MSKGILKYIEKDRLFRYMPNNSLDKKVLDKVMHSIGSLTFVGNFYIKGFKTDGYLYELDSYDKELVKNIPLKENEYVFRYTTYNTAIGGMTPLIKINKEKLLAYFGVWEQDEVIKGFTKKGEPIEYLNLVEYYSYSYDDELFMGTKNEMEEHGMNFVDAEKTANDHLKEDKHYYSKMKYVGLAQGGQVSVKYQKDLEELLQQEGWSINYYDNYVNEVPKDKAKEISLYRFDPYYQRVSIKVPTKKEVTLDWVMNKVNNDVVYKSFTEKFNQLLKSQGDNINAYATTYGIGVLVGFGFNIEQAKEKVEKLLNELGIVYHKEYSDAQIVLRYKISKSKDNLRAIEKITANKFAQGGEVSVEIVNQEKVFNQDTYKGIYGDNDHDGLLNADDPNPNAEGDKESIEQVQLADLFSKLLSTKKDLDKTMYEQVDKLKEISPKGSKIYARTKTPYSILNKLINKRMLDKKDPSKGLTDMVGTTIVAQDFKDVNEIKDKVKGGALGKIVIFDDYYSNPKDGYMAYHFIVLDKDTQIPFEVQLKTKRMKLLNQASHNAYKYENLDGAKLLKYTRLVQKADEGNLRAQKTFDLLTNDLDALSDSLYKDKTKIKKYE
jgi:ppGpp synthetase/RelA/SpoT-type nucleotidyltranferase